MASTQKIATSNLRLAALLSDVTRGNIKIPVFQRGYVWSDEQIMSLLDSIYRGYPVGSLLLWSTREALKHERDIGGFKLPSTPMDYPVQYVLDGQQRLTTLYGVFNSDSESSNLELASRFNICFVPETEQFIHYSAVTDESVINLRVILDTTKLLPELARFTDSNQKIIAELIEKFKDYEFPLVTIKDRTNQEVCRVFQRINSSGTKLGTLELLSAWTWSDEFDLRNELESLLDALADKGYGEIDQTLLMRCLAAVVLGKIDPDELVDAAPEQLIAGVNVLKNSIYDAVDFLEKELHIKNIIFVPFPIMIVPLVKFFSLRSKPNAKQLSALRQWFWHCAFTQKYKAGTNKLVLSDMDVMTALAIEGKAETYSPEEVSTELFLKTWRINSTAAKAAICLLAQYKPRSLLSGRLVDLDTVLAAYNAREFHHIYPKAFLLERGIPFHESNSIANVCFLTASDNKTVSDTGPEEYFLEIPEVQARSIFASALIPTEACAGKMEYSEFLKVRAELLTCAARDLVANGSPALIG
jgi:hypothetical protein